MNPCYVCGPPAMRCRWEPRHTTTQPASRQGRHRLLCVLGRTVRDPRRVLRVRVGGSFLVCQPAPCCVVLRPDCCAERPFGPSPGGAERVRRDAVCCVARYGVDVRTHGAVFTYSASTAATYDESITTAASFDSGSIVLHGNILYAGGKFKTHHEWGVPFTVAVAETAAGTVFNSAPDAAGFPSPALHGLRLAAPPLLSECCACGHRAWWLLVRVPGRTLGVIGFDVSRGHEQVFKFDSPVCRSSGCGTRNQSGRMTAPALLNGAQIFFLLDFARSCRCSNTPARMVAVAISCFCLETPAWVAWVVARRPAGAVGGRHTGPVSLTRFYSGLHAPNVCAGTLYTSVAQTGSGDTYLYANALVPLLHSADNGAIDGEHMARTALCAWSLLRCAGGAAMLKRTKSRT